MVCLLQVQEHQLGQLIRNLYFSPSSPSLVSGISTGLFNQAQVHIRADAGGEGGVIFDSSIAVAQGIWPANTGFNTTLANGKFLEFTISGLGLIGMQGRLWWLRSAVINMCQVCLYIWFISFTLLTIHS